MTVDELLASERLLTELQEHLGRVRQAFEAEDDSRIVELADEFMGYADDLAELAERIRLAREGPVA